MIQAALHKHGGTATLREVRVRGERVNVFFFLFFFQERESLDGGPGVERERFFSSLLLPLPSRSRKSIEKKEKNLPNGSLSNVV